MCGIYGILRGDGEKPSQEALRTMRDELRHRGPNDEGLFEENGTALGHLRLSIIDLSPAGHQPMVSPCGRWVLVFNGEIYNYLELRRELQDGWNFVSHTDTEVLLAAWARWGADCLHRFNGMFAFALHDRREQVTYLVRDRFGIKPLYWWRAGNELRFASEPLALVRSLQAEGRFAGIDEQTVFDYLVHRRTHHCERTFFTGVSKLRHGCLMTVRGGRESTSRWYALEQRINRTPLAPDELREMLTSSLALRLRSDVPVGASLSGGMDSGAIVSLITTNLGVADFSIYSAVYGNGHRGDESSYIDTYNTLIKNRYRVTPTTEEFLDDIDAFVQAQQEPTPSTSPYADYRVVRLAAGHVTVLLSGQGGDETTAGYEVFNAFAIKELLLRGHVAAALRELAACVRAGRGSRLMSSLAYMLAPHAAKAGVKHVTKYWVEPDFMRRHTHPDALVNRLYESRTVAQALRMYLEDGFEHYLMWGDRNQMRFSLEGRYPFLDHRLVERLLGQPLRDHVYRGNRRVLMRRALEGVVPPAIMQRRDKMGYLTPEDEWLRHPRFRERYNDELAGLRGIIRREQAERLYRRHVSGERPASEEVWQVMCLAVWLGRVVHA